MNTNTNTGNDTLKNFVREQALAAMEREAREKGSDVTREQIVASIARDPEGAAARRFDQYEALAQDTLLAVIGLRELGLDPAKIEALDRAIVDAHQRVGQDHEQPDLPVWALDDAPEIEDGQDFDDGPQMG